MIAILMMVAGAGAALPEPRQALLSQQQLDMISRRCATPRRWLVRYPRGITISLNRPAPYQKVSCILAELKRANAGPVALASHADASN